MPREFVLPDLGEGISEAQIVRLLVKPGERVDEDQYLMEVETDKAAVEIPSPYRGIAKQIHVKEGQTVNVGDVIITFDDDGASATQKPQAEPEPARKDADQPPSRKESKPSAAERAAASATAEKMSIAAAPAVRKLAREHDIDLARVEGTGPGGRITREDVERHIRKGPEARREQAARAATAPPSAALTRAPAPVQGLPEGQDDADKWGQVRRVPLNQIRKTIAAQMSRSAFTIPHVTHGDEADITLLERARREINDATGGDPKITPLVFVIRAVCAALRKHPIFNASFDEEGGQIVYKKYINVGVAVDAPRGLIVPVIRDADQLTLRGIALALRGIAEQVRTNQFAIEDLRGGTFTITNVGALGGTFSTPIINHPEVAILGLGRIRKVPVLRDGALAESTVLPISLSFDHRAADGANAARFTREIIDCLEQPFRFLLD